MSRRVALLIDGGHLRALARRAGRAFNPDFVEAMARTCAEPDEELYRILYYDCAEYVGSHKLPVSGRRHEFNGNDRWLHELAHRDLFAVRRGVLKFRGWEPKTLPMGQQPTDSDFTPRFEQKGVDMRIGLDIATLSAGQWSLPRAQAWTSAVRGARARRHAGRAR